MPPEVLIIVVRAVAMMLLIAGGITSLRYGFHVYQRGTGAKQDLTAFELGPVKLKTHSVGSAVMATAVAWAWLGVSICPSIEKSGDSIRVYSLQTPSNEVSLPSLETRFCLSASPTRTEPNQMERLFRRAVAEQSWHQGNLPTLDGRPARLDPNSVTAEVIPSGKYVVSAKLGDGSSWVQLAFEPSLARGKITFVPKRVEEIREKNPGPIEK
jgi:hypothetical protein